MDTAFGAWRKVTRARIARKSAAVAKGVITFFCVEEGRATGASEGDVHQRKTRLDLQKRSHQRRKASLHVEDQLEEQALLL
jgi:hypothetical protein